jgi:hypothetical protein
VARTILDHWQLALLAGLAGLAVGCILLAAIYLTPLVRLLLARGGDGDAALWKTNGVACVA